MNHRALIFDLDGVLVDTAKYHYQAWKTIADEMGIPFDPKENESFKGVGRDQCVNQLAALGHLSLTPEEKTALGERKNRLYVALISTIDPSEVLPGVIDFITDAQRHSYLTAVGSASANTPLILELTGLAPLFDAVADGNRVKKPKPDPAVFLQAANDLALAPTECIVFEDAAAGIEAAHRGKMVAIGVGEPENLSMAELVIPNFVGTTILTLEGKLKEIS